MKLGPRSHCAPALLLCALLTPLAGCDGGEPHHDSSRLTQSGPSTSPSADVDGEVGTPVGLKDSAGESIFSLTIEGIRPESSCPSRLEEGNILVPENGTFIVVDLAATMSQNCGELNPAEPFLTLDSDAFAIADSTGALEARTHTVAAHGCYSLEDLVQPFINPGEELDGMVVLDTKLEHGYLVYNPWGVPGNGWRWKF